MKGGIQDRQQVGGGASSWRHAEPWMRAGVRGTMYRCACVVPRGLAGSWTLGLERNGGAGTETREGVRSPRRGEEAGGLSISRVALDPPLTHLTAGLSSQGSSRVLGTCHYCPPNAQRRGAAPQDTPGTSLPCSGPSLLSWGSSQPLLPFHAFPLGKS